MNEFADQGDQPTDDPWPRSAERARPLVPAAPAPHPPDPLVRVRIVWDAGIPPPVVSGLGQAERDLFLSLVSPDSGARKVRDVQYMDFTLSPGDGFVLDSPAQPQIAVGKFADAINVLLGRAPDRAPPLEPARPAPYPPDPPVRVRIVWDAGIPPPVARGLRQAERDLFLSLVSRDPGAPKVRDFTLSAGDGFVLDSPAQPQIAVGKFADAINVLLGRALPPDPFPPRRFPPSRADI
jgi:hypothetical protein